MCNYKRLILATIFLNASSTIAHTAPLSEEEVFDVMYKVDNLDDGDNFYASVKLSVVDRYGKSIEYKMQQMRRYTDSSRFLQTTRSHFTAPEEVAGVIVLSHDYKQDEQVDDRWISIPGIENVKRITSSESGSLMGSDISFADLDKRHTNDYSYRYLSEKRVDGWDTWVIEFLPKTKEVETRFGYSKGVVFVDKASFLVVKAIFWVSGKQKVMKFYELNKMEEIAGIWTPVSLVFYTKRSGVLLHRTKMELDKVRYNMAYQERHFVPEGLAAARPEVVIGLE